MLTILEKVLFLQRIPLLGEVPTEALAHMAALATEERLAAGDALWQPGEPSAAVYFVLEGEVHVSGGEHGPAHRARAPAELGAAALVARGVHVTTATAVAPTSVLRLPREDFDDVLAEHPDLARALLVGSLSTHPTL